MTQFLNVVGATAVQLQDELKRLNEEFHIETPITGDESYKELQTLVKSAQKQAKGASEGEDNQKGAQKKGGAKNAVYVWLKSPAYFDKDGEKRIAGGFYHIDLAKYPRIELLRGKTTICEIFDEAPTRKLSAIAQWFGVNFDKHSDEELLKILLTEPAPF